jgi:hypothetical protein
MDDVLVVIVTKFSPHILLAGLAGLGGTEEEVVCWNWKTGRVLARLALADNAWFSSLALLTPTTFMISTTSSITPVLNENVDTQGPSTAALFPPVIQVYSFAPDPNNPIIPVQPLSAHYMDDTTPRPVLVTQLELPKFAPGVIVTNFEVRPDPAFPPPSKDASRSTAESLVDDDDERRKDRVRGVGQRKQFTQNPSKGILVFELSVHEPHASYAVDANPVLAAGRGTNKSYELFVLRETLVGMAKEGEERLRKERNGQGDGREFRRWEVERIIPWEDWGETHSRFMDISMKKRNWVSETPATRATSR